MASKRFSHEADAADFAVNAPTLCHCCIPSLLDRDSSNLGHKVSKITNVYGQYQQVESRNRDDQRSSVGRLWKEEDLHCMKMDVFCADTTASLDMDARIQKMKTFHNWNKDWQQPQKGVGQGATQY
jgi:hypothetical protein